MNIKTITSGLGATLIAALLATSLQGQSVTITTMAGETLSGNEIEVSRDGVTLTESNGNSIVKLMSDVARVSWSQNDDPAVAEEGLLEVRLVDNSLLWARQCTIASGKLACELAGGTRAEIATRNVRWVRLQQLSADSPLAGEWDELVANEITGDLLIVRREVDGEPALSAVDGVLGDMTADALAFKFDDSELQVERSRIDTLVFYHPSGRQLPEIQARATDRFGQIVQIRDWQIDGDTLLAKAQSGAEIGLPLKELKELDFEVGRVLHLADQEPATFDWTPFVAGPEGTTNLKTLFALSKNLSFSGKPLSLYSESGFGNGTAATRQYARGLAVRSQTRLIYRLPDDYRRLVGWIGIDPEVRPRGDVKIIIEGDGRPLLEQDLSGRDSEPIQVDLDLKGVRRLSLEVRFGEAGDLGDRVHVCDFRAVK